MNTPLTDLLSPKARRVLYLALTLAGIVVAVLQIVDVNVGKAPDVLAYLGTVMGAIAVSNTNKESEDSYAAKHGR